MRRRAALGLALLAALVVAGPAAARPVRVFAVSPKISPDWLDTRAHFRDKLFALVDRRWRTAGAPAIQRGADDVVSHLRFGERNLVVLPEYAGLPAAFVGSRGAAARRVPPTDDAIVQAVVALLGPYAAQSDWYAKRFPAVAQRGLPVRELDLALTDTFARTGVETFAALAARYHVWVVAGVVMARHWRIDCTSRATFRPPPGATRCDRVDPAAVRALRDPDEPNRNYAYEATTDRAQDLALVFDPRGHIVAREAKAYLTDTELPGGLDLVPGDPDGLGALRTPLGTLGVVTSKDSWMPDVVDKLDERGADLLVQPEFFVGDTLRPRGLWAPDTLKASLWSDVLRHPGIEAGALASLTGNLFSFSADAQSHVVVKPRGRHPRRGRLAGQPLAPGFRAVLPYGVADPVKLAFDPRRHRLGAAGERMLPGGPPCPDPRRPGACADGMREGVTWADVNVARHPRHRPLARRKRGRTPFSVSRPIDPCACVQRNVDLATRGRLAVAAWEQRGRVALARSRDGGRHWSRPAFPAGRARRQWWPQVALGPDGRVWLAWQDDRSGGPRAYYASGAFGRRLGRAHRLAAAAAPQWRPTIAATGRGRAVAAWIDERARSADDAVPQAHVEAARLTPARAGTATRIDTKAPVAEAAKLDDAWAPDLAARGRRVVLAWIDFHTYDWRVWSRVSRDGGRTWARERAVTDASTKREALDDAPRAALGPSGPLVAFTDHRAPATIAPAPPYTAMAAVPGQANHRVVAPGPLAVAPAVAPQRGGFAVAWQDMAAGPGRILLTHVDRRGRPRGRRRIRVDDGGRAPWNAWRPALAPRPGGGLLAAWEDERDGPGNVFFAIGR